MPESPELVAARVEKAAAIRAHDDLTAARVNHPIPWRASKARNLVDAEGVVVLRPGLPKRQVAAMAREANARAAVALAELVERLDRAMAAELDATPPQPGCAGAVTIDDITYRVMVPDVLRISPADFAAGLTAAGCPCEVVSCGGVRALALAPFPSAMFVHVHEVNPAAHRALSLAGWDFGFVRLFDDAFLGTSVQGLPRRTP